MAISHFNILQSLGWSVLNSLWQMAFLWVLFQLIIGVFKSIRPTVKSLISTAFLISGFIWFIYTFFSVFLFENNFNGPFSEIVSYGNRNLFSDYLFQLLPLTSVCYLFLLVFYIFRFIRNYRYVKKIGRLGLHKINIDNRIFVNNVSRLLGITKTIQVWISEFVTTPLTIGFIKPVILIPLAAINSLSVQQLEAVLLHEITHIRRNDFFINLVIHFIRTILFFNPFVKAFNDIIEIEREKSCDEMVMQFQYNAHEYATALLALERISSSNKTLVIGITGRRSMLLTRIESITGIRKTPYFSLNFFQPLITGLIWLVAVSLLLTINKMESGLKYLQTDFAPITIKTDYSENKYSPKLSLANDKDKNANHPQLLTNRNKKINSGIEADVPVTENSGIILADYIESELPDLKKYQEEQVKKTVEASKNLLEAQSWKSIEREIGEVYNQDEKEKLRTLYHKKFKQLELENLDKRLKENYFELDWDRVNEQLSNAINQVRIDSIQNEINSALSKLEKIKNDIIAGNNNNSPDSVISLAEINKAQQLLINQIKEIKTLQQKKVVHL